MYDLGVYWFVFGYVVLCKLYVDLVVDGVGFYGFVWL